MDKEYSVFMEYNQGGFSSFVIEKVKGTTIEEGKQYIRKQVSIEDIIDLMNETWYISKDEHSEPVFEIFGNNCIKRDINF